MPQCVNEKLKRIITSIKVYFELKFQGNVPTTLCSAENECAPYR